MSSGRKNNSWGAYALLPATGIALMATCVRTVRAELPRSGIVWFHNFINFGLLTAVLIVLLLWNEASD